MTQVADLKQSNINANIFKPSLKQDGIINQLKRFEDSEFYDCFILTGAAGTGKSTITKMFTDYLIKAEKHFHLCAPTGRAAKIISHKTQTESKTLHNLLYTIKEIQDEDGNVVQIEFIARENISKIPTIYIVDESSMISNKKPNSEDEFISKNSLLLDLINYVKQGNKKNKIVFIGDNYQLPPVKANFSPALDKEYLVDTFGLKPIGAELKEIFRQDNKSYILKGAYEIKEAIDAESHSFSFIYKNVENTNLFIKHFVKMYLANRSGNIILGWRNISIHDLNQQIRNQIFGSNSLVLCKGDQIVLAQNSSLNFNFTNGTFLKVEEVLKLEDYEGFKFADVMVSDVNSGEKYKGKYKLNIDFMLNEKATLDASERKRLYALRIKNNKKFRELKDVRLDAYLSALKVRYGYAITVHKAQGGEWGNVFIYPEIPFGPDAGRWLYTAITRASENIYSFKK
jgi:ATP-dependent exoDNAse (exonuclease V) alpha subunit